MTTLANAVLESPSVGVDADLRITPSTQAAIRSGRRVDATAFTGDRANGSLGLDVVKGGDPGPLRALAAVTTPTWIEVTAVPRDGVAWDHNAVPLHARFGALLEPRPGGGTIAFHMLAGDGPYVMPYRVTWEVADGVGFLGRPEVERSFSGDPNAANYGNLALGKVVEVLRRLDYAVLETLPGRDLSRENAKRAKRGRLPLVACEQVVQAPPVTGEKRQVGGFLMIDHDGRCVTAQSLYDLPERTRAAAQAMSEEVVAATRRRLDLALSFEEALAIGLLTYAEDVPSRFRDCLDVCLPELARRVGHGMVAVVRRDGKVTFEKLEGDPSNPEAAFEARMTRETQFEPVALN